MKQLINKFLFGFIFVLGLFILFPVHKADATTYALFYSDPGGSNIYVTINLNKVYDPGEKMQLTTLVQDQMCSNRNTSGNLMIAQILGPDRSYFGVGQTVMDHNTRKGETFYSSAYFTAPQDGGNFIMKVNHTSTLNYTIRTQVYKNVFDLPFIVTGCNPPVGYVKCSNEGGICSFDGEADVQYGCKPFFKLKEEITNSISCDSDTFGGDPAPDIYKACFYKAYPTVPVVKALVPSVKIWANGKNPEAIKKDGKVIVTWDSENAAECNCTYGPDKKDCGSGTGYNVYAKNNPYTLAETKTFTVTCSDKITSPTARIPPSITLDMHTYAGLNPTYSVDQYIIGPSIQSGDKFVVTIYSHNIEVIATRIDTQQTIAKKIVEAVNNITLAEWKSFHRAPSILGTKAYYGVGKPSADVLVAPNTNWIHILLDRGHQSAGEVIPAK